MPFDLLFWIRILISLILLRTAWIDARHQKIYHWDLWTLSLCSGLYLFCRFPAPWNQIFQSIGIGILFFGIQKFITWVKKSPALGMGDVKLLSLLALILSLEHFGPFLIHTGVLGLLTRMLWRKSTPFPLAPALVLSALFALWFKDTP